MKDKQIIIYIILLFLVFSFISYKVYPDNTPFSERWDVCLDLLEEGELYEGQPICEQAPFVFLTAYPIKLIFGDDFSVVIKFFVIIFNILLFFLIYLILKKEVKSKFLFIFFILYLFICFIPLVNDTTKGYASLITSLFFMFGFYCLFYSELKNKEMISGIFFGLSIFSKFIVVPLFGLVLLVYLIRLVNLRMENNKIKYDIKSTNVWSIVYVLLPIFVIFAILSLIWPNMMVYSYFVHSALPNYSYFQGFLITIKFLFSLKLESLFSLSLILISLIAFIKNRDVFSFAGGFGLFIMLFLFIRAGNIGLFKYRYLIVFTPLILIGVIKLKDSIKNFKFKVILVILILILIYPGIKMAFLSYEMLQLEKEVAGGLGIISEQGGKILTDKDRSQYFSFKVNNSKQDIIKDIGYYDGWVGPRFEYLGVSNLTKWEYDAWERAKKEFFPKLDNNEYDMVIIGPNEANTDVNRLLDKYLEYKGYGSLDVVGSTKDMGFVCGVVLPNLEHRSPHSKGFSAIAFSNESYCQDNSSAYGLVKYYYDHFNSICKKDELTANAFIRGNFKFMGVNFDKFCEEGVSRDILFYYQDNELREIEWIYGFFILFLVLLGILVYSLYPKRGFKKYMGVLNIIFLVIILLLIVVSLNKDPYRVNKESSYYSFQKNSLDVLLFPYKGVCGYKYRLSFQKLCNNDIECREYVSKNLLKLKKMALEYYIKNGDRWLEEINKETSGGLDLDKIKCLNI